MSKMMSRIGIAVALTAAVFTTACSSAPEAKKAEVSKPAKPTDAALAANVKAAIDADPELKPFDLRVDGKGSDVTINGATENGEQMAKAGMIAEKVDGVKYVFNDIMPKN
ncbi:BON domain-containing protein [Chitinibacteraceae bacterium HSL-7]